MLLHRNKFICTRIVLLNHLRLVCLCFSKRKNNSNQIVWLMRKVHFEQKKAYIPNGFKTFQEFLDSQLYSHNTILCYERIFGHNYVSTGGKETTEVIVNASPPKYTCLCLCPFTSLDHRPLIYQLALYFMFYRFFFYQGHSPLLENRIVIRSPDGIIIVVLVMRCGRYEVVMSNWF